MAKDNKHEQKALYMLNTPMPRLIFQMALPTIIAFIINTVYSLADTFLFPVWEPTPPQQ